MSVRRSSSKSVSSLVSFGSRRRISTSSGVVTKGFESSGFGYGSSGGYDIFSKSVTSGYEIPLFGNEKQTMINLNDRLAFYLEKVNSMEKANSKLELQIRTFYENKSPMQSKDMSSYFQTISDLRTQILSRFVENSELRLKLDNARMAAADFQIKYETEKNMRMIVEADLPRLRGVMGEIKMSITDLEAQHTGAKEELLYLKKTHEEDLHMLRAKQSGSVNVEIDSASHSNLGKMLEELRSQYETLVEKNHKEVEQWYQTKVETWRTQVSSSHTEISTSQTEIKRTVQSLDMELKGLMMLKQQLEQSLVEVRERYSAKLRQLQIYIDNLQEEQQRLNTNIQEQSTEYQLLLDIRMRLEVEIAEYRRLLGGELQTAVISNSKTSMIKTETVTSTVKEEITEKITEKITEEITEEKEDVHNPLLQRRVKVIVEEMVDGQVVATSIDEKVQDIN
ncbi:keratin 99 [Triplophysa dalaica]|uniref:keratin 99 n=1 Tax=Triplophysa dalaica TaxID=1582913 RepID=UPI0024DF5913|nr:keratin 99 [Triplophysa dalaica]XP_056591528.1 keratin 99 [Triplophysa dalaica]